MYNSRILFNYNNGDFMFKNLKENINYLQDVTSSSADFTVSLAPIILTTPCTPVPIPPAAATAAAMPKNNGNGITVPSFFLVNDNSHN